MRILLILFILLAVIGCAKTPEEQSAEAIDVALSLLSNEECDEALRVLQDVDDQSGNPVYLQVLASAYACKAGFNEIDFISNDLANLNTTTAASTFTSLAKMSLSPETVADSTAYTSIRSGINVILNSTTGAPAQTARTAKFGTRKSGDMGVQALVLNVVNLGKFLNFYGNVNAAGAKSLGTNTNSCFINYTDPRAQAVIAGGAGGVCNTNNDGHPDIVLATATGKRRVCEGLMLFTNLIDILDNIDLSGSSSMSKLEDVSTKVNTIKAAAVAAGLGTLINMTSQSTCESAMNTPANLNDMEYLYSLIFETGLQ